MNRKIVATSILAFVFAVVTAAQFSLFAADENMNPITSPEVTVTPTPYTQPITSPEVTGTVTPTPAASQNNNNSNNSNNNSNNNNGGGSSNHGPFVCSDSKPHTKPNLFQINTNKNSATLYFTPLLDANRYSVIFGNTMNEEYGYVSPALNNRGVQKVVITHLQPNKTYYFKVNAVHGCAASDWSGWMKVKTTTGRNAVFYPSIIK